MSADLMVSTGDQLVLNVSRQMAPCLTLESVSLALRAHPTYRLTADVRMPYLGLELHLWRLEWVVIGYPNINVEFAAFIRSIWWTFKGAFEMCYIIARTGRLKCDL